ncbi:aspartate/glutamate racemase family protein [Postechiella marina]|uniref:Aspartate/glutamate racemase family protein n=1 Tax=Postechiella marina TaxID=943941 RepID=A0ABP8C4E4_9FLAO
MEKVALSILGLGSRTTSFYLSELNELYNKKHGNYSTCPLLLLNANFNTINSLLPKPSKALNKVTQNYLTTIGKLGAKHILVPNITLHETIDGLEGNIGILHPVLLTIDRLKENNWSKIVLFGSIYSMKSNYINTYLSSTGIEVVLPTETDMVFIDHVRKEAYAGTESKTLIKNYHLLIKKYSGNYPVVLACTELSILKPLSVENLVDMAQLQMEQAIKVISVKKTV